MKKLMLVLLLGGFLFTSCQKDDLSSVEDLNAVEGNANKGNNGNNGNNGENEEICEIDLTPGFVSPANATTTAKLGAASYFDLTVNTTDLAGSYPAWCIDQDASLNKGQTFDADVYSSYETLPVGTVELPDNFDLVNWLLNQDLTGYSIGDIQNALWILLEGRGCTNCNIFEDFSQSEDLVKMAETNGEGYIPGDGDQLWVVLIPRDGKQSIIIPYDLECDEALGCETAYAKRSESESFCEFYDGNENRWGWNTLLNTDGGPYTFDVWAGAGKCDTSKGVLVGTATVTFENDGVKVDTDFGDYTIKEEHVYAGTNPYPLKNGEPTLAPGQYYVENLSGVDQAYVILHWEVCGEFEDE